MKIDFDRMKSIVFDFNGTLLFDDPMHVKAWDRISRELRGIGITPAELQEKINGVPNIKTIYYMSGGTFSSEQCQAYSRKKEAVYREICRGMGKDYRLVPGAEALFDRLKARGIPFTIATASIPDNVHFFMESFRLDRWFSYEDIVLDDGSYSGKTEMFQEAFRRLHADPGESLIFEDSDAGIRSAYETGCRNIIVVGGEKDRKDFGNRPGVVGLIRDFREILPAK